MLYKGTSRGPDRESYLSDGGKLWMPAARGPALYRPSWGDLLKLSYMKLFGLEVVSTPPAIAGGSGFSGGGGGSANTDRFIINHPAYLPFTGSATPAASTTYYVGSTGYFTASAGTAQEVRYIMPVDCTLTKMYAHVRLAGAGSAHDVNHYMRKNNTTDCSPSVVIQYTATGNQANAASALTLAAGDDWSHKIVTPAWTTLPTGVFVEAAMLLTMV